MLGRSSIDGVKTMSNRNSIWRAVALAAAMTLATPAQPAEDRHHHDHAAHSATTQGEADPHAAHRAAAENVIDARVELQLRDAVVLNQDGEAVKFRSQVVGEDIVVVTFVYTTCTTVCPVVSALFQDLQNRLGQNAGSAVKLVSVTVDPLRDTPQRLKAFSRKYSAGPGWTFITGSKGEVDKVLNDFGAYTPNYTDHPPLVMVGDGKTGQWLRFYGFPSPARLMGAVDDLQTARQGAEG
jgi:protein SCO1/2